MELLLLASLHDQEHGMDGLIRVDVEAGGQGVRRVVT
jgi:hypothetical protein